MSDPSHAVTGASESHVDTILAEYFRRVDEGQPADPAAFIRQHQEHADALREFFAAEGFVEKLAGPKVSDAEQVAATQDTSRVRAIDDTADIQMSDRSSRRAGTAAAIPKVLGRYRVKRQLGAGAMGAVYLAFDTKLEREVALKIPKFQVNESEEFKERFVREARAAATLRSPNICPVYDVSEVDGIRFIAMAYIEGQSLSEQIEQARFQPSEDEDAAQSPSDHERAKLVRKLALAMDKAHQQGIIHRDLKPGNVTIDNEGEPIVMDFGLARLVESEETRLTQDGAIIGSPAYMSPEQVKGETGRLGPATDIYSLGVILYELLTGQTPFRGSVISVLSQISTQEPPGPSQLRPDVDRQLEAICLKMMSKRVEDRYANMAAVAEDLSRYLSRGKDLESIRTAAVQKPTRRKRWIAVSAAAALVLLALAAVVVIKLQTPQGTVRVEISDPKITVTLDGDSLTIDDSGQQIKITPGEQELLVERGELTFKSTSFEVGKGQNTRLKVDFVNEKLVVRRDGKVIGTATEPPPAVHEKKPSSPAVDSTAAAKKDTKKKTSEKSPPLDEPKSAEEDVTTAPDDSDSEKQPRVASEDSKPGQPAASDGKPKIYKVETEIAPVEAVIELPGKAELVRTGGAGRFLIFHVPESGVLAVVDAVKRSIVKDITVPASVAFAANRDKLLIAMPRVNQLQRWDLATLQREEAAALSRDKPPKLAVMGASGDGPLALLSENDLQLWDVQQMKPLQLQGSVLSPPNHFARYGYSLTVSADGKTFCGWTEGISGQRFHVMRLDGQNATLLASPDDHSFNERWAMPSADGSMLVRYGGHAYARDLKPIPAAEFEKAVLLPTEDPRFLLAVRAQDKEHSQVTICTAADLRPVYTLKDVESVTGSSLYTRWGRLGSEPRVRYLHDEKLIACIPDETDRVIVLSFDLKSALDRSRNNYLFVFSKPDPAVTVGQTFNYQMAALSSSREVTYRLDSGPDGMSVTPAGMIRWPVVARPVEGIVNVVILAESADGQQYIHAFEIAVERGMMGPTPDESASVRPESPATTRPKPNTSPKRSEPRGEFVKVDEQRLELPGAPDAITPGLDNRTLLLAGDRLGILGEDGWSLEKSLKLNKPYVGIGEREDYFVAISNEPQGVYLLDKKTLRATRSLKLSYMSLTDLALHPTRPLSYVAYKGGVKPPRYKFLIFDESTGEGREGNDWIGKWLAVEPGGRFLLSGYSDIYERGARLLKNPDRWHVVPDYGSLDWLIRYKLSRSGLPQVDEIKQPAGGNGKGVRLSADGKRVTYLSHVGYPKFSGNLAGWDTTDFGKIPVSYETKDRGRTDELAYHPFLPLVASPGGGAAVFFHRETGRIEADRTKGEASDLDGLTVHRIYFSPDGKNLLFDAELNGIHYLHKAALKLTPDELKAVDAALRRPTPSLASKSIAKVAVPLKDLDALRGGIGKKMTTSEIARASTDSVVVVKSGDTSGTGFVVGADGYVLTCAHCVSAPDSPRVTFRSGEKQTTSEARVLNYDKENDLALLKIETSGKLPSVRLAVGHQIATGDRVSVIGHPGVGNRVLDYTMTEGIVSSPDRKIDGAQFVQTSASVNPGSSGGPMFNDRGMVIGMVVLKARIEGAGFAIPADTIGRFLLNNIKQDPASQAIERQWHDAASKRPLDAAYLGFSNGQVNLKRISDGNQFSLPLNSLSAPDQVFVRMLTER